MTTLLPTLIELTMQWRTSGIKELALIKRNHHFNTKYQKGDEG